MGNSTGISWTDATWNPIIGCTRVSAGCKNCYAEQIASRFSWDELNRPLYYSGVIDTEYPRWNGKTVQKQPKFNPMTTKNPRTIFVCSMGDLFHESVPFEWIHEIWDIMKKAHHHKIISKIKEITP